MSRTATPANVPGSCADTRNSRLFINSVNPKAAAIPIATPTSAVFVLCILSEVYLPIAGPKGICGGVPCNSLEFKGLHDQSQDRYRPCAHYCTASRIRANVSTLGRVDDRRTSREEQIMSKTRIATTVLSRVVQKTRKSTGSQQGPLLLAHRQSAGAAVRRAILMLIVMLLAANPLRVSAAAP